MESAPLNKAGDLREIERSYPKGTIYTIYSINLRNLYELTTEKEDRKRIEEIKLESIIITWIKARYLQLLHPLENQRHSQQIEKNSTASSHQNNKYTRSISQRIQRYVIKYKRKLTDCRESNENPYEIVKEFIKELINTQGEVFYFTESVLSKRKNNKTHLDISSDNFKISNLVGILKDLRNDIDKETISNPARVSAKAIYRSKQSIDEIKKLFDKQLEKYIAVHRSKNVQEINDLLISLNQNHERINREKRGIKNSIYKAFRGVEEFLVSDEFGKFAEDPFFKVSKSKKRYIKVGKENCFLQNVTKSEEKLLRDGHEFLIFRGNLKDKWLTSLTYKIWNESQKAAYFIRLSRLGLLQIRKEQYLGSNYEGEAENSEIDDNLVKILREYQSNNYLIPSGKFDTETLKSLFPEKYILKDEKVVNPEKIKITPDEIKKAKIKLRKQNIDENLIDVLVRLLYSQKHYEKKKPDTSKSEVGNSDDVLQVAVGFAKLLEFRTNSNYSRSFQKNISIDQVVDIEESVVQAKEIDEIRKSNQLERQKYTLIFLYDLKESKDLESSIKPQDLHEKYSQAISCLLQGSLEKADFSTALKIFQHSRNISPTGEVDTATLKKMNLMSHFAEGDSEQIIENTEWYTNPEVNRYLDDTYLIPPIPESKSCKYEDLSTWENELCIFSPERGLIFFNDKETLESGKKITPYRDYWRCIVRGVEYTVALRATLQLLETRTTRLLREVPELLGRPTQDAEENIEIDNEILSGLTSDLASVLKLLPGLRSIAITTNAFRSGHSVKKFEFLYNNCFNFEQTFGNIQKNIDDLTDFLTFFVQEEEAKDDRKLSKIALVFTVGSILYVSVSFSQDFYSFFNDENFHATNIAFINSTIGFIKGIIGKSIYEELVIWRPIWTKILILLSFSGIFWIVWSAIRNIKPQYKLISITNKVFKTMRKDIVEFVKLIKLLIVFVGIILFLLLCFFYLKNF